MKTPSWIKFDIFPQFLLLAHLLLMTLFVLNYPGYNWDILAYIGLSVPADQLEAKIMHQTAYGLMRERLSEEQFSLLVSTPWALDLFENPENFASFLTMFEIKPLYILIVRILSSFGISPIDALLWLSLLPALLICLLIYDWLRSLVGAGLSVTIVILFSISSRLFDIARVAFPDALSGLMLLMGIWCLLRRKWIVIGLIIWILSIWVRTTNILYVVPMTLLFYWSDYFQQSISSGTGISNSVKLRKYAVCLISSIVSYFWITWRYDYSWWVLFYHSFIGMQPGIENFDEPFSFDLYWEAVTNRTRQLVTLMPGIPSFPTMRLPMFLLILVAAMGKDGWVRTFRNLVQPTRDVGLSEAAMLSLPVFLIFLLLFPQMLIIDRFFLPYYAIIILFASSKLQEKCKSALQT